MGQNSAWSPTSTKAAINLKELVQDSGGNGWSAPARCNWWSQTMNTKTTKAVYGFALWLAGIGIALAQSNSIESFEVSQQAGKTIVFAFTTKEPLRKRCLRIRGRQSRAASPSTSRTLSTPSAAPARTSARASCAA